jgi:two-component system, NarL family, sensor histidine kinase DesK
MRPPASLPWAFVDPELEPATAADAGWYAAQRTFVRGWRRVVFTMVPLVYLVFVGGAVAQYSHGAAEVGGYLILGAFVACYVGLVSAARKGGLTPWQFWAPFGALTALFVAELPFARAPAFVMALYLTMIIVARLGVRAAPVVAALTLAAIVVPVAVSSWHQGWSSAISNFTPIAIPVVAVITFAVVRVLGAAGALAQARAELARLAAENERSRIARDLHDLLGHSLTTITVKAGLARRLGQTDPGRAVQEIAEVEELSRQALADVRAAVSNYREVTLATELARGKELLRASGVAAELPSATDMVDGAHQELFGWALREGLTNVARHARATRCTVTLSATELEICDDGVGGSAASGHGLAGLKERIAAAGGCLEAGPRQPRGWRLRVALGPQVAAAQ